MRGARRAAEEPSGVGGTGGAAGTQRAGEESGVLGLRGMPIGRVPLTRRFESGLEEPEAQPARRVRADSNREATIRGWGAADWRVGDEPVAVVMERGRRKVKESGSAVAWERLSYRGVMPALMSSWDQHPILWGAGYRRVMTPKEGLVLLDWDLMDPMAQALRAWPGRHAKRLETTQ